MNHQTLSLLYQKYLESNRKVSTDTRSIEKGAIFFCLKGPTFNGNAFAQQAISAGAGLVVMDDPDFIPSDSTKFILVENALKALQDLATYERKQWKFPVIGIGGSNGKTTTKELVTCVLQKKHQVHATKGNLNNHIGVPLTILSAPANAEMAVIELGTNAPGEIEALCRIALPDHGIITNIGKEHLEGFGSLEAVAFEESQLYMHLKTCDGLAFVNAEDEWLMRMSSRLKKVQTYGKEIRIKQVTYHFELKKSAPFLCFEYGSKVYKTHLFGAYNFSNIMSAVAIGLYFDVPINDCLEAVCEYVPANHRSQITVNGNIQLIADCYNANPSSMELALRSLADMEGIRKVAFLGDMFELGEHSQAEHEAMARLAMSLPIDKVILIGEAFTKVNVSGVLKYQKAEEVITDLPDLTGTDPVAFLLKASRGMKLETLMPAILSVNKR